MKNTFVFSVTLLVLLAAGCASEPEPMPVQAAMPAPSPQMTLTPVLLQRLGNPNTHAISDFQFVLNGALRLENDNTGVGTQPFRSPGSRVVVIPGGAARQAVAINDNTFGRAVNIQRQGSRINIMVSFEENPHLFLTFSATAESPMGFFELVYTEDVAAVHPAWGFRGHVSYGGEVFEVFYAGSRPRISIMAIEQGQTPSPSNTRTASGALVPL